MGSPHVSLSFIATAVVAYSSYILIKRMKRLPLPPGPTGYPIIGNVFGPDMHHLWLMYAGWSNTYGSDVLSYETYGRTTVILNSHKAVTELLEKRSSNYSDRPRQVMVDELMGWQFSFSNMRYSDRWRRHRKMFHQYFQPRTLSAYHPLLVKSTLKFLEQLAKNPDQYRALIQHWAGSTVLQIAYGYQAQAENDYYIGLIDKALEPTFKAATKAFLVDYLPILKYLPAWFPGAGFKRMAAGSCQHVSNVINVPFRVVQKQMAQGTAEQSFVSESLHNLMAREAPISSEEEEIIKNCAGIMYLAGSDTTVSLLLAWQLAMLHYPEVQKRAQEEVDKVCGQSRLPDFNDKASMPYVEATILEVLRWHAITPLGVPHCTVDEDEYNGYRIPAGATVMPNTWAILHDPELYHEPFEFIPERFLDEKQENVTFAKQPDPTLTGGFGYGRRICPGQYFALTASWIVIANILATYNLSKLKDVNGNVIEPEIRFADGIVSHPEPYRIHYEIRFKDIQKWIDGATMPA